MPQRGTGSEQEEREQRGSSSEVLGIGSSVQICTECCVTLGREDDFSGSVDYLLSFSASDLDPMAP